MYHAFLNFPIVLLYIYKDERRFYENLNFFESNWKNRKVFSKRRFFPKHQKTYVSASKKEFRSDLNESNLLFYFYFQE
ncbi:hypothetical protein LEP1GSC072_2701 [Leptospira noguchii str. Bonito]|nr:hypothetical protein LEP1GSC072_2701 [Leptospira noguchii str. Bonito]